MCRKSVAAFRNGVRPPRNGGSASRSRIVHNIGRRARVENVLFAWRITGHYRYF